MTRIGTTGFFPKTGLKSCRRRSDVRTRLQLGKQNYPRKMSAVEMTCDEARRRDLKVITANGTREWQPLCRDEQAEPTAVSQKQIVRARVAIPLHMMAGPRDGGAP